MVIKPMSLHMRDEGLKCVIKHITLFFTLTKY